MKKLLFLCLLISTVSYGQTTLANKLKITNPSELSGNTQIVTRGTSTGETGFILKTDVQDVLKYATASALPATGEAGKFYYTIDDKKYYTWNGTIYDEAAKISDVAYDATSWNGSTDAPSKNAVRDKIESLSISAGATNLTTTQNSTGFTIVSDSGTDAGVPLGNGTNAGASLNDYTTAEKTKLSGIATGATANSSDATLLARANHTGTQTASTISDIQTTITNNTAVLANTAKVSNATHTGDVTGANALTLSTVNSNVGSFGSASKTTTQTVNAKGLTTAISQQDIAIAESQVTNLTTDLAAKQATLVSGTNIKTINSASILGSGDITAGDMTLASTQTNSGLKTFLNGTIGLRNVANTFTNLFSNTTTAARTYTFQDKSGTIADLVDVATKMANPSLTTSYIPKALTSTTIGDSRLWDTGTYLGLGTVNTPLKDFTLGNQSVREIGVEDSNSVTVGRDLTVTAGRAINFIISGALLPLSTGFLYTSSIFIGNNGDIYALNLQSGTLFKQTGGTGVFGSYASVGTGVTSGCVAPNGDIYVCFNNGDIKKQTGGTGLFVAMGQTSRFWFSMAAMPNGDIYASVGGSAGYGGGSTTGDIYKLISGTFTGLGFTARDYRIAPCPNGDLLACVNGGSLYRMVAGSGVLTDLSQTNRAYQGISTDGTDIFVCVYGGDIWKQTNNTGALTATNQTSRNYNTIVYTSNSTLYAGGYNLTDIFSVNLTSLGTSNLAGGKLILKDGTGKGNSNASGVEIWTGQTTTSGTNMQTSTLRLKADNSGLVTLPSTTTAIIDGDSTGKSVVTKEWIASKVFTGQIIVTSGTSFTTPSTITTATVFNIELVGAGGGGGGGSTASGNGSGGGAGGYCFVRVTGLSPSTTYTCAIGAGSAGGTYGNAASAGGNTTLTIGATTYTANGGGGGLGALTSSGGAGGTATNGDINITGQSGADNLAASTLTPSASGGSSPKGWGLGGSPNLNGVGKNGTGYGSGGSSGKSASGSPSGGNGTNGIIFCQWFN